MSLDPIREPLVRVPLSGREPQAACRGAVRIHPHDDTKLYELEYLQGGPSLDGASAPLERLADALGWTPRDRLQALLWGQVRGAVAGAAKRPLRRVWASVWDRGPAVAKRVLRLAPVVGAVGSLVSTRIELERRGVAAAERLGAEASARGHAQRPFVRVGPVHRRPTAREVLMTTTVATIRAHDAVVGAIAGARSRAAGVVSSTR